MWNIILSISFFLHAGVMSDGISKDNPALLIISYDGFRYDYTNKTKTPHMDKLKDIGAYGSLINVFETKTFPNHQSLATGLYPESHGVLANHVFDPKYNRVLNYSKELWSYSDDVTPIWTLNELKKRHSGVMMWPGAEFTYRNGVKSTFEQSWNQTWPWHLRVDTALNWIQHPTTAANLVMIYIEDPDLHAHPFGPDSSQVSEQIKKLDELTGYLVDQLKQRNLSEIVNVFLLSDHGMAATDEQHVIDLTAFTNESMYLKVGSSPVAHIFPHKGFEEKVFQDLINGSTHFKMKVYNLETTPKRWHITNSRRAPPILLVAEEGYAFQDLRNSIAYYAKTWNFTPTPDHKYGVHGYDNTIKNMHPFFIAWGPNIRKGIQVPPFNNIDLYSLWAYLLRISESEAPSNGSYKSSPAMYILLDDDYDVPSVLNFLLVAASIPVLGLLLGLIALASSRLCPLLCQCKSKTHDEPTATAYRRIDTFEQGEDRVKDENEEVDTLNGAESRFEEQHLLSAYATDVPEV